MLKQLLENEFHSAWFDGCVIVEAVLGPVMDSYDLLLLGMMDDTGDEWSYFPDRTVAEAAQRLQRRLPDPTTPVACTTLQLQVWLGPRCCQPPEHLEPCQPRFTAGSLRRPRIFLEGDQVKGWSVHQQVSGLPEEPPVCPLHPVEQDTLPANRF